MRLAIEEWNKESAGYRQIVEQFNVPWSTLHDRLKNNNKIITGAKKGFAGGFSKSLHRRTGTGLVYVHPSHGRSSSWTKQRRCTTRCIPDGRAGTIFHTTLTTILRWQEMTG